MGDYETCLGRHKLLFILGIAVLFVWVAVIFVLFIFHFLGYSILDISILTEFSMLTLGFSLLLNYFYMYASVKKGGKYWILLICVAILIGFAEIVWGIQTILIDSNVLGYLCVTLGAAVTIVYTRHMRKVFTKTKEGKGVRCGENAYE